MLPRKANAGAVIKFTPSNLQGILFSLLFSNTNKIKWKQNHLKQIHSLLTTCGLSHSPLFLSGLLSHCSSLLCFPCAYASSLLNQIKQPNILTYNTIIRGFSSSSLPENTILFFKQMRQDCIFPNKHTFPLLLKAKIRYPFQLFAQIIKFGFGSDQYVQNSLVSALARCGCIDYARQVFDEIEHKDMVAYTALINGYVKNGRSEEALQVFVEMRLKGVKVDEVVVVSALCAVGMLGCVWFGRWIHGFYVESGRVCRDVYIGSGLVDMYSKCGFCYDAHRAFQEMPYKNVVSWTALLAGYERCDRYREVLLLFQEMLEQKVEPNESTLTCILTACAHLGALDQGRWVHEYINSHKLEVNSVLGTALIDMYSKCGCVQDANLVFERILDKDVYPWTAMINGLAVNGDGTRAVSLFSEMLNCNVKPNEVTFIGVLSACSHAGLVENGRRLFSVMASSHGIQPNEEHYGCMVDLLGRAGHLREAINLLEAMPMEPSPALWGALYGACITHKTYGLGELIGKHLLVAQPHHSGRYALLANLYSACQNWKEAAHVRKMMKSMRVEKTPGWSWIEVDGLLHEFVAFDKAHSQSESLYLILDRLSSQLGFDEICSDCLIA